LCDEVFSHLTDDISPCKYYNPDELTKLTTYVNTLIILHLNICFLHKHIDNLCLFLDSLPNPPDLLCLTETQIKGKPLTNLSIPEYRFVHVDSKTMAGGVAIYISNKIKYEICSKQYWLHNCEILWLNIHEEYNKNNKFIIGVIYHHPTQTEVNKFLEDLSLCLEKISSTKIPFYLFGDINIDITLINRTKLAKDYINLQVSHCSLPLITLPTRVTSTSSTIIDHIITNDARHQIKPLVIRENLTDHYPVMCSIHIQNQCTSFFRDKSKFSKEAFWVNLQTNLENMFYDSPDLNLANFDYMFNQSTSIVLATINKHAP